MKSGDTARIKHGACKGEIVTLESYNLDNHIWAARTLNRGTIYVYRDNLELVKEERKFKIGDRVKTPEGNIGTVIPSLDKYKDSYRVHLDGETGYHSHWSAENLTAVKEEKMTTVKYKVGDTVRYLGGKDNQFIGIGDVCKVTSLSSSGVRGKWKNPTTGKIHFGDGNWHAESTNIELVKDTSMKVTLPNGLTLEGTADQINSAASALGFKNVLDPSKYYKSSHMGLILISEMKTDHIKNALLKMYRAWVESLSDKTPSEVASLIAQGPNDKTFIALFQELNRR